MPHPEAQVRGGGSQQQVDCITDLAFGPSRKSLFRCPIRGSIAARLRNRALAFRFS